LIQWTRSNFIARREAATLAKTLRLFIPSAETGSEKRFAMHAGVALHDLCGQGSREACFPLPPVAGCWIYFICVTVMDILTTNASYAYIAVVHTLHTHAYTFELG
jgi:hypothetical protein